MNTLNKKQVYTTPQINRIELDNEISLTLDSTSGAPPAGPGEPTSFAPDYFNPDPFKTNVG
jgi:hypothetical protein